MTLLRTRVLAAQAWAVIAAAVSDLTVERGTFTAVTAAFAMMMSSGVTIAQSSDSVLIAQAAPQTEHPAPKSSGPLEEIVVSGTRIIRDGYEAPTPVTVINSDEIDRSAPQNLADFINKMPEFVGSATPHNSATAVSDTSAGVNNLNLRALGANRTLVLLDGVRVVGSSLTGYYNNGQSVDTNEFPEALVSRVDIVTGGASAVYGSDALAGVVNFVLNKDFTGVKGDVQGGVTTYGDDGQYKISLTGGSPYAGGRGHVLLSLEDNYVEGIPHLNRPWALNGWQAISNPNYTPTNGQPSLIVRSNVGLSSGTPGGLISSGPLQGVTFGPGGTPYQFNYGALNNGFEMQGGDWRTSDASHGASLDVQSARQNVFFRSSYDLTDDVKIYVQTDYAVTNTQGNGEPPLDIFGNISISQGNPFIPASVATRMQALGVQSFTVGSTEGDMGMEHSAVRRTFQQYLIGANGKFSVFDSVWNWDAYYETSIANILDRAENDENGPNLELALDAVRGPTGAIVCRSSLTNPANGCVPWNPMGLGVNSQSALNYVTGTAQLNQIIREDNVSATLRGEPFRTWAGPVSLAFGAEYRKEQTHGSNDPESTLNEWLLGDFKATEGSYHVAEGFLETVVPLAKDLAWAKSLDLNGAVRETDYSTSGAVKTWKVGVIYRPFSDLRFRTTVSEDIRAPNLGDLFAVGQSAVQGFTDPFHGGAPVLANSPTSGNPNLKPEDARTYGAGIVYEPSWASGFSASFDYYDISVSGAITSLSGQQIIDECFVGNAQACSLITRSAQGVITTINLEPTNVLVQRTRGFDIETGYQFPLSRLVSEWQGDLSFRAFATHIITLKTDQANGQIVEGAGVNDYIGTFASLMAPRWRWLATASYGLDPIAIALTARGISAGVYDSTNIQCTAGCPAATGNNPTIDNNHIAGAIYADLSLTYKLGQKSSHSGELYLTVENLANRDPPVVAGLGGLGFFSGAFDPITYDALGRIFRAGVRFKL